MSVKKSCLAIRADATKEIGTGHMLRCIALAQRWHDSGGKVVFISHCKSELLLKRITAEKFELISLENPHPDTRDIEVTLNTLSRTDIQGHGSWTVIDGYNFDSKYQRLIKDAGHQLLCLDDYGHASHYCADLILNQNISAQKSFYKNKEPYTQLLLGTNYALLRREFQAFRGWKRDIPTIAKKFLITLGGSDSENVTLKVIKALKQMDIPGLEAQIVVGPANPYMQSLEYEIQNNPSLRLVKNAENMPDLMAWAEIALTAGGSTCWELAYMGLPFIILVTADNQKLNAELLSKENISLNLGNHQNSAAEEINYTISNLSKDPATRFSMSKKCRSLVDGQGAERVQSKMICF